MSYQYKVGERYMTVDGDMVTVTKVYPSGTASLSENIWADSSGRNPWKGIQSIASGPIAAFSVGDRVKHMGGAYIRPGTVKRVYTVTQNITAVDVLWDEYPTRVHNNFADQLTLITSAQNTPSPVWSVRKVTNQELSEEFERDTGWVMDKPKCECGALKAKTTHTTWCPLHPDGGTPPYVRPKERLF